LKLFVSKALPAQEGLFLLFLPELSRATQLINKHTAPAARCVYYQPAAPPAHQVGQLFLLNDLYLILAAWRVGRPRPPHSPSS
jgi:hypothetical protein